VSEWETFCDVGYYHMWRLRLKTERGWNDGFHINTKAEAEGLCELLNKLERELNEAREQRDRAQSKIENQAERIKYLEGATNHATGTPLSKMTEQRDRLAEAILLTLMENLNLCDGDICTLKRLKDTIGFDLANYDSIFRKPSTEDRIKLLKLLGFEQTNKQP